MNLAGRIANFIRFPFNGFTYFLNLKVLFNFPSPYLLTIGLVPVFSFRWSLPPVLGCIPKQPDSSKAHHDSTLRKQPEHNPTLRKQPDSSKTLRKHIGALAPTGMLPSVTCCSKQLMQGKPDGAGKVRFETTIHRRNTTEIFKLRCSLFIRH